MSYIQHRKHLRLTSRILTNFSFQSIFKFSYSIENVFGFINVAIYVSYLLSESHHYYTYSIISNDVVLKCLGDPLFNELHSSLNSGTWRAKREKCKLIEVKFSVTLDICAKITSSNQATFVLKEKALNRAACNCSKHLDTATASRTPFFLHFPLLHRQQEICYKYERIHDVCGMFNLL